MMLSTNYISDITLALLLMITATKGEKNNESASTAATQTILKFKQLVNAVADVNENRMAALKKYIELDDLDPLTLRQAHRKIVKSNYDIAEAIDLAYEDYTAHNGILPGNIDQTNNKIIKEYLLDDYNDVSLLGKYMERDAASRRFFLVPWN